MDIQSLIEKWFNSPNCFFNKTYERIAEEQLTQEYQCIRNYLLTEFDNQDRVAIQLDYDYRYPLTLIACMEAGVTFIPTRLDWPKSRIEQIHQLTGFKQVITDDLIESICSNEIKETPPPRETKPDDTLYIMFTSGTTGEPKGVSISRHAYGNFLSWVNSEFEAIGPSDHLLNSTIFTFDVSLMELALVLTRKPKLFASQVHKNIAYFMTELDQLKISVSVTVPNNFSAILNDRFMEDLNFSSLRFIILAGSRFPKDLYEKFKKYVPQAQPYNCYGPTEATIYCTYKKMSGDESQDLCEDNVSIGKAIPGCEIRIDEDGKSAPPMEKGELLIGGEQLMQGYVSRPEQTDAVIKAFEGQPFYHTGDLAFQDSKGEFYVVGRIDDTVKISGQRANLSDIDGYIQSLPYVQQAATIAIPDPVRENKLICFVVLAEARTNTEINKDLKKILIAHQLPQKIIECDSLPLGSSGKIDKKNIKANYLAKK